MARKPSQFIWYELLTADADAAARFYGAVVGWSVQPSGQPGLDYRLLSIGDRRVGGLMSLPAEAAAKGMRPGWLGYLGVDDVDRALDRIQAAGGAVHMPATDIPGVGRFAMVADPQGAPIYVMTPNDDEGQSVSFARNALGHVGWNELRARDWRAALAYGDQFGWAESDAMDMGPMGTYLLFNAGGEAIGGMMDSPDAPRPTWLFYFAVDDIEAARSRLETGGGAALHGPHQVPGGSWVLQAQDPQGAMFA